MSAVRSVLYLTIAWLIVVVYSFVHLFLLPFGQARLWGAKKWNQVAIWLLRAVFGVKTRIIGAEKLEGLDTAVVLSNHQSTWETFAFFTFIPRPSYVLKKELLRVPFWGWVLATLWPIPINRSKGTEAIRDVLKTGETRLNDGHFVIVFPEGTRTQYGEYRKFSRSGAQLAVRADVPVVPIAHNSGSVWPKGLSMDTNKTITAVIGEPIHHNGDVNALNAEVEAWIRAEQTKLAEGVYD